MKAVFNLKDSAKFKSAFKLDTTHIDVLMTYDAIYFVNVRTGFYSHVEFPIISRENFEDLVAFRIPRKMFLNVLEDASITIEILGDNEVTLYFTKYSDQGSYTITIEQQSPSIEEILNYIKIIDSGVNNNKSVNLSDLSKYIGIFNSFGGVISVGSDGRVRLNRKDWDDILVYINVTCDIVSIPVLYLQFLLTNTTEYYAYQSALIGISENTKVVVTQLFYEDIADYDRLMRSPALEEYTIDLEPVYKLGKKALKDVNNLSINLTSGKAYIKGPDGRMSTPFSTKLEKSLASPQGPLDLETLNLSSLDVDIVEKKDTVIQFPLINFNLLFPKAGNRFMVRITKRNILISNGKGVTFVTRR